MGFVALILHGIQPKLAAMSRTHTCPFRSHLLFAALFLGTFSFSAGTNAQSQSAKPDTAKTTTPRPLEESASRGIFARDPSSIVKCKEEYWVFYTGRGVPSYHSKDLVKWERGPAVFKTAPEWISKDRSPKPQHAITGLPTSCKVGGRYLLYYSVSSFGKMTSAIGLATNPTLDPDDPAYHWTDQGVVVQHERGRRHTMPLTRLSFATTMAACG